MSWLELAAKIYVLSAAFGMGLAVLIALACLGGCLYRWHRDKKKFERATGGKQ